jgi:hypothetical protein
MIYIFISLFEERKIVKIRLKCQKHNCEGKTEFEVTFQMSKY